MTVPKRLLERLPWVAAGAAIGATAVALWPRAVERPRAEAPAPPVVASAAPAPQPDAGQPDAGREREIGAALRQVKVGMTRAEVEARLGPAHLERPQQVTSRWWTGPDGVQRQVETPYLVYYCSPPDLPPGPHLMTVEYDAPPLAPIPPTAKVLSVSGPHVPD